MKYYYYKADGTFEVIKREKKLEYEETSKLVGGWIEFSENFDDNINQSTVCINEEGIVNNLKVNPFFFPKHQENFHGDIIEGLIDQNGDFVGFPDDKEVPVRVPKELNKMLFQKDKVFTIIAIGDFMAQTTRSAVKATGDSYAGKPSFKENKKGARKVFTLRNLESPEVMIFEGIDLPFKVDGEVTRMSLNGFSSSTIRGNALFNLVGNPDEIREYVKTKNLNPFFTAYDRINHIAEDGETETLLFMDRFASCKLVADRQQAQLKREGKNVQVGVGFAISSE